MANIMAIGIYFKPTVKNIFQWQKIYHLVEWHKPKFHVFMMKTRSLISALVLLNNPDPDDTFEFIQTSVFLLESSLRTIFIWQWPMIYNFMLFINIIHFTIIFIFIE